MAAILVDDHLLVDLLVTRKSRSLARARSRGEVHTTGYWYYRLCHAVQSPLITGKLSAPLAKLPDETARAAVASIVSLPDDIGLVSLRDVAPMMARLVHTHRLNLINLEALASAKHLGAVVHLAAVNEGPLLTAALEQENIALVRH